MEELSSFLGRGVFPCFECFHGCFNGNIDVLILCRTDINNLLLSGGIKEFKRLSRDRGDKLYQKYVMRLPRY
jgi:hypothetical protein